MIDRTHKLPIVRQCEILDLARSTAYYTPKTASAEDLALMRRMDELHLEYPFAGSRMLRDLLRNEGKPVGLSLTGIMEPPMIGVLKPV